MLDFNIINALIVLTSILVFILIVKPYFEKKNFQFYDEIKLGLMLFGFAFRDDKIKEIANTILFIVQQMETLDLTAEEKHYLAVDEVFRELLEEFNIELPEEAISLLIQIAVKMLPPTHQPQ
jgi:hypothetical protein